VFSIPRRTRERERKRERERETEREYNKYIMRIIYLLYTLKKISMCTNRHREKEGKTNFIARAQAGALSS